MGEVSSAAAIGGREMGVVGEGAGGQEKIKNSEAPCGSAMQELPSPEWPLQSSRAPPEWARSEQAS